MKSLCIVFALCLIYIPMEAVAQWTQTAGPEGATVLSSHTAVNGTTFVGTLGGGIYRSTNGADRWESANAGLTDLDVYELAGYGGTVYAGTRAGGVFVSTDNGSHWRASMQGVLPGRATALLATEQVVLLTTADREFFRSTDDGASWSALSSTPTSEVVEILLDMDGVILAGDGVGMLYRSTDDGVSWVSIDPGYHRPIYSLAHLAEGDVLLGGLGGVYRSQDSLQTWHPLDAGMPVSSIISLFVDDQNTIYAGTSTHGVYRWNASASAWESVTANILPQWVVGFADLPGADFLALFSLQSVQRWDAASSVWNERMEGFIAPRLYTLTEDPAGRLYTGAASGHAYRSNDGGNSWQRVFSGRTRQVVNAVIPVSETVLVIGTQGDGVFFSSDGGVSWVPRNDGLGNSSIYAMHRSENGTLIAATGKGLFLSTNDGMRWSVGDARFAFSTNAVSGVAGHVLAAMDSGRIALSSDHGASWRLSRIPTDEEVVFVKRLPWGALVAAVYNTGLFISADDGATWNLLTAQFAQTYPGDLLFAAGKLYYATYGMGVWTSTDGGVTWNAMNEGLTNQRMSALLQARDGHLYASSQGAGVFRSTMQIVGVADVATAVDGLRLVGSWPHPFTSEGNIRFVASAPDEASLRVYDVTGRCVLEQELRTRTGENSFTVASSRLRPGVYRFQIAAGGATATGRFLVVR